MMVRPYNGSSLLSCGISGLGHSPQPCRGPDLPSVSCDLQGVVLTTWMGSFRTPKLLRLTSLSKNAKKEIGLGYTVRDLLL